MNASPTYSASLDLHWRGVERWDLPFILSSWLRSYCLSPEMRPLPSPVYHELYAPVVRRLVDTCDVLIAHDPEMPDVVLGFRVMRGTTLHYVFTKRRFRQMGVAKWMLKDLGDDVVYTPQVKFRDAHGEVAMWNYGSHLIRAGWRHDPMARWDRRPITPTETTQP